jgi:hypothetical protein
MSRQGATCCGQLSGNRCHYRRLGGTAAARLPQPRRSCPLVGLPVDTDRSAGRLRTAGVRDPCRIAGRCPNPRRTTAICNGWAAAEVSGSVSGAGRVDRWTDTPTVTVPAGRTCDAVAVRSPRPPRCWGRTAAELAADTRTVPPLLSVVAVRGSGHLRTARRICHGRRPAVIATGTGRRGGGRWSDGANAGRRGRAGRSGGRGAGRGHRSSPAG